MDTGFESDEMRLFENRLSIINVISMMLVALLTKADKQKDQHDQVWYMITLLELNIFAFIDLAIVSISDVRKAFKSSPLYMPGLGSLAPNARPFKIITNAVSSVVHLF